MFSETWRTSERKYDVIAERDVKVRLSDGTELNADIFRPDSNERFPALLDLHAYDQAPQSAPIKAQALSVAIGMAFGQEKGNAWLEAGDPAFFVRRGYVHVIASVRGSGKSGGKYAFFGPQETQDGAELIGWIARQPWCSGNVGMFGVSYFAISQLFVASDNPPALKCLFAPWAATDMYRDGIYQGGVLNHTFWRMWAKTSLSRGRPESDSRRRWGNGLLWEREPWPNEKFSAFEDSPWQRGHVDYHTPKFVEETEVIGPIVLNRYASTTDPEVLWFISLRHVDPEGNEKVLTRGWLRGSHREVDPKRSRPWAPFHPHTKSEPLTPGRIYEFNIPVLPTGVLLKKGGRLGLRISSSDDQPKNPLEMIASGHLRRQSASRITVYGDADHPSHLLLPITRGNILGTFISGAEPFL